MRMTQFIGLTSVAKNYLQENCKKELIEIYRNGKLEKTYEEVERKPGVRAFGMFEEELQLYDYILEDGSVLKEVEQASIWSSGPLIFTCLKNEKGKLIKKWSKRLINSMI